MKKKVMFVLLSFLVGFSLKIPKLIDEYRFNTRIVHLDYASGDRKDAVREKGDIEAYKFLVDSISRSEMPCNVFGYAFIMAVKYEYVPANYDIYKALDNAYGGYDKMNDKMRYMAKYFLRRGAMEKDKNCIAALKKLEQ